MSRIFISYSHSDGDYARELAQALEAEGFAVFIDDRIDNGWQWPHVIQEGLDRSAAFVVVMTPRAYQSEWVAHPPDPRPPHGRARRQGRGVWHAIRSVKSRPQESSA